jgi:hypothetical protein
VLERATSRTLPLVNRAADFAPVTPACCNVCRTCTTSNLIGVVVAAVTAIGYGAARLVRKTA